MGTNDSGIKYCLYTCAYSKMYGMKINTCENLEELTGSNPELKRRVLLVPILPSISRYKNSKHEK